MTLVKWLLTVTLVGFSQEDTNLGVWIRNTAQGYTYLQSLCLPGYPWYNHLMKSVAVVRLDQMCNISCPAVRFEHIKLVSQTC